MKSRYTVSSSVWFLFALLVVLAAVPARAQQQTDSKITAVTVYADRALVTRTAKINLQAGEQSLEFGGLPAGIMEDSVSAGVRAGSAKILGIELQRKFLGEAQNEKIKALQKEIQDLQDAQRRLNNRAEVDRKQLEFADKLQVYQIDKVSKELAIKDTKIEEWDAVLKFLEKTRTERLDALFKTDLELRDLNKKLHVKQSELGQLMSGSPANTRTVIVNLDAKQAGEATIEVRYVIWGASWTPSYDARTEGESKDVELTYYGTVVQRTGEEWKDVDLSLSTARPNIGAHLADLTPLYLMPGNVTTFLRPQQPTVSPGLNVMSQGMFINTGSISLEAGNRQDAGESGWLTAALETRGTSALYKVTKRQNIPSGDQPQRVTVSTSKFHSDMIYVIRPKLQPYAFLKALTRNNTENHLSPGTVNVFLRGDYIGQSWMSVVAPGQEFPVYLGINERIKVKRELLMDKQRESFWGKKFVLAQSFRITVENYTGAPQTFFVYDQIPVSKDSTIEVRAFKADLKPTQIKDEKGEIQWKLDLKNGEKRIIEFSYEVVFPEEVVADPQVREQIKFLNQ